MRSHEERVAETKRRIAKIEREKRRRYNTITMASAVAACLALLIGASLAMPGIAASIQTGDYSGFETAASIFHGSAALGYIVIGLLAFLLGVCVTESEATQLVSVMKKIAANGIAIIFITHRLDEVMAAADSITILRDGKLAATREKEQTSVVELAELMIGRKGESMVQAAPRTPPQDRVAMSIRDLHVDMPGEEVRGVSLEVYEGEILGIGGLAGQGKLGIPNGVMSLYDTRGSVTLFGEELKLGNAGDALRAGIAMVSEDRKGVGLLLDQSIEDNIVFNAMQIKGEYLHRLGLFTLKNSSAVRKTAERMIHDLDIRCFGPMQHTGTLSGGNQQKVCIARALVMGPRFLFVSEPTRGIDIGAKKLVLETLVRLNREQGMTIVIVSSELQELKSISDRIAIISEGRLVDILSPDASDADFGLAMSGIKPDDQLEKGDGA